MDINYYRVNKSFYFGASPNNQLTQTLKHLIVQGEFIVIVDVLGFEDVLPILLLDKLLDGFKVEFLIKDIENNTKLYTPLFDNALLLDKASE